MHMKSIEKMSRTMQDDILVFTIININSSNHDPEDDKNKEDNSPEYDNPYYDPDSDQGTPEYDPREDPRKDDNEPIGDE